MENDQTVSGAEPLGEAQAGDLSAEPGQLDPKNVRVVDVEEKETGEVIRRDCYDLGGGPAEMGDVMRLNDGELWLRSINWARERSQKELTLTWEPTGLSPDEIGRVGVFAWPTGEPVRVFAEENGQ